MQKFILLIYFITLSFSSIYASEAVDISKNISHISILEHSDVYFDKKNYTLKEILDKKLFKPYKKSIINNAQSKSIVWVKFELTNSSDKIVKKCIVLDSPSLEHIILFQEGKEPIENGFSTNKIHSTLYYYYDIELKPHETETYYLRVLAKHKSFFFSLTAQPLDIFRLEDTQRLAPRLMMIGFLLGLVVYSFMLAFYSKDKSYFYYAMYLFFLLWHQVTFLGLTQIYAPKWFVLLDSVIVIPKLGFILIFAVLFAVSFLKVESESWIFKIYMLFLAIAFYVIFFLKSLPIALIIGVFYVFFNLFSGLEAYFRRRVKQARLFILGFSVVSIAYIIIILDSFGITSNLVHMRNILLWATVIEVLLLNLAFADRYQILQSEKEYLLETQQKAIKKEVEKKTAQLNRALKEKEILLKEVHHRVKNNLQIILSIIRLQSIKSKDKNSKEILLNLENRINAISKTYNMLVLSKSVETIDMKQYINALINDIRASMCEDKSKNINIELSIDLTLPLKQAVYIGIIINELVTNSFKHAFDKNGGTIKIKLFNINGKNVLEISDNGKGFSYKLKKASLGLKIIDILIKEQLEGSIKLITEPSVKCLIEF